MNKTILADKLFDFYQKFPHCVIARSNHMKDVRSRFDYKQDSDISIIAANCVGGEIYSLLGLKFTSPLINISINRDQFIELCSKLKASQNLEYSWAFQMKEYISQPCTGEYNAKSFEGLWKFTKMWDYVSFLNGSADSVKGREM
jgi:uncharacterized protein (DUF1919 family)